MPAKHPSGLAAKAIVFSALGDQTRLSLLTKLSRGRRHSIAELTEGTKLTRQAVTKHLRVLERVKIVHAKRTGRESLFELDPQPIHALTEYLETVSKQWDAALDRLKNYVEKD